MIKILFIFITLSFVPTPSQASEVEALVNPEWEVELFTTSEVNPGLAVLVGSTLYFSQWLGKADCPSQDLYSVSLRSGRNLKFLGEIPCVSSIDTDGTNLFVRNGSGTFLFSEKTRKLQEVTILPSDKEADAIWQARLHQMRKEPSSSKPKRFGELSLLSNGNLVDIFTMLPPYYVSDVTIELPEAVNRSQISWVVVSKNKRHAFFLLEDGTKETVSIARFNIKHSVRAPAGVLGSHTPNSGTWETLSEQEWSIHTPKFMSGTEEGFLVYEKSSRATNPNMLSYYSPNERKFFHVLLPEEQFLSGARYSRGGILLSLPGKGRITWVGSNPKAFSLEEGVSSSDMRRNPKVPAKENNDSSTKE